MFEARGVELVRAGLQRPPEPELRRRIAAGETPDVYALPDALGLVCLDEQYFAALPGAWGGALRRLPLLLAQLAELARLHRQIELVLTWSEAVVLPVALLLHVLPGRPTHVGVVTWPSKKEKGLLLRLLRRTIDRLICPPPLQQRFAVEWARLSPTQAPAGMRWMTDLSFWVPAGAPGEMICCVGREMRDYPTLVSAVRPTGIRCHIAAGAVTTDVDNPWLRLDEATLPPEITVGGKSPKELRDLYRASRFVVIPLFPSDTDNGVTAILESFAMERPVICTRTPGQIGILEDRVNCLLVPPGDATALRAAILELWNDPELCRTLGRAGRDLVERDHTPAQWVASVSAEAEAAVAARSARSTRV